MLVSPCLSLLAVSCFPKFNAESNTFSITYPFLLLSIIMLTTFCSASTHHLVLAQGFVSCSLRKKVKYPTQIPSWNRRQIQNHGSERPPVMSVAKLGNVGPGPVLLRPSALPI